jgi:hypothetical protein
MIKSQLSDEETAAISECLATQDLNKLVEYFNKLLYERGKGADGCTFPIYMRDDLDGCYAIGYLNKIESFLFESSRRLTDKDAIVETVKYIHKLKNECQRKDEHVETRL